MTVSKLKCASKYQIRVVVSFISNLLVEEEQVLLHTVSSSES